VSDRGSEVANRSALALFTGHLRCSRFSDEWDDLVDLRCVHDGKARPPDSFIRMFLWWKEDCLDDLRPMRRSVRVLLSRSIRARRRIQDRAQRRCGANVRKRPAPDGAARRNWPPWRTAQAPSDQQRGSTHSRRGESICAGRFTFKSMAFWRDKGHVPEHLGALEAARSLQRQVIRGRVAARSSLSDDDSRYPSTSVPELVQARRRWGWDRVRGSRFTRSPATLEPPASILRLYCAASCDADWMARRPTADVWALGEPATAGGLKSRCWELQPPPDACPIGRYEPSQETPQ
jgi:hypothetical protein